MTDTPLRRIPVFPLPNVVLFPQTDLPLHIFEPRYRTMLADALATDRTIGIQLLHRRGAPDPLGRPALFPIGCAGEVVEHEPLEDGRSNVVLRGVFRYRIEAEQTGGVYRLADVRPMPVEPLPEAGEGPGRAGFRRDLIRALAELAALSERPAVRDLPPGLGDEGLVNQAAVRLGLNAEERYRLLAMDRLEERYAWILGHIQGIGRRIVLLAPYRREASDPTKN